MKYISKKLFILPVLSLLISALAYPQLPAEIATHFDFNGVPDNYSGKLFVFVIPLLSLLFTFMAEYLPKLDPKGANYARFPKTYQLIHWLTNAFLLVGNLFIILYALGYEFHMGYVIGPAIGIIFMVIGNYMPKFKQSFFVGIKTPWALVDEENWYKTHRFAGKLWMLGGLIFVVMPFLPQSISNVLMFINIIIMVAAPYVYSYLLFRNKQK